jgi:hypothetical protein
VRYHRTTGEGEGDREKISETTDTARPTPPEPPLWRIDGPEIVQDLRGVALQKPRSGF